VPCGLLHELIFVCDEPIDGSESLLSAEANQLCWVQVISLTRNSGQHLATAVGILYSSGDWILTMDEDLTHSPEMMAQILIEALEQGLDLLYVKSTTRTHASSIYRDFASKASKICMKILTRHDYSMISSFRIIRGEVARAIAISVDGMSYLDAALFAATSEKRRGVFYSAFSDLRHSGGSGYSLKKLLRHYGRMIMSVEFSGLRMLSSLGLFIGAPLMLLMLILLIVSFFTGTRHIAPGWLSLFSLGVVVNIFLLVYAVYSLKLLSALFFRSSGFPNFLAISRKLDVLHMEYLRQHSESYLFRD
jgi:glycosyltransferase involved in cell wall biosynthesis